MLGTKPFRMLAHGCIIKITGVLTIDVSNCRAAQRVAQFAVCRVSVFRGASATFLKRWPPT